MSQQQQKEQQQQQQAVLPTTMTMTTGHIVVTCHTSWQAEGETERETEREGDSVKYESWEKNDE